MQRHRRNNEATNWLYLDWTRVRKNETYNCEKQHKDNSIDLRRLSLSIQNNDLRNYALNSSVRGDVSHPQTTNPLSARSFACCSSHTDTGIPALADSAAKTKRRSIALTTTDSIQLTFCSEPKNSFLMLPKNSTSRKHKRPIAVVRTESMRCNLKGGANSSLIEYANPRARTNKRRSIALPSTESIQDCCQKLTSILDKLRLNRKNRGNKGVQTSERARTKR